MHIKASPLLYKDVSQSWVMNGWRYALLSYGLLELVSMMMTKLLP